MECDICSEKCLNVKNFQCDGCEASVCIKCSKVTASEIKVLELRNGRVLKFLCAKCLHSDTFTLLHQTIDDKETIINSKEEIIALLKAKVADLESAIQKQNCTPQLYSAIVQNHVKNEETIKLNNNIPQIMIIPKQTQKAEATKRDLLKHIRPSEIKVGIKNTRELKNGGVILNCYNKQDVEKLRKEAVSKMKHYEVQLTKLKMPKIKIPGYDGGMDINELETNIREQNTFIDEQDKITVTYLKPNKRNKTYTIYCDVSPLLFHKAMNMKKVIINWERYPVFEELSIQRCFCCQEHYHKSNKCPNQKSICEHCAEQHPSAECSKTKLRCVNCVKANQKHGLNYDANHAAGDPECPSYKYLMQVLRSKIDYGDFNGC